MRAALASTDGKFVSRHFGNCPVFCIVEIDEATLEWKFVERRDNTPACDHGGHDEGAFADSVRLISDCDVVFVAKIGPHARRTLDRCGFLVLEQAGFIEDLLARYIQYLSRRARYRGLTGNMDGADAAAAPKVYASASAAAARERAPQRRLNPRYRDIENDHPCFSSGAHGRQGRLH
ncbi:MAG: hypothetical protein LBU58_00935, partial [Clostridiales bacterium]|nr:hypothetical protein [Clostridiales bacterium]